MNRNFILFVLEQIFFLKALAVHSPVNQYFIVTGAPHQTTQKSPVALNQPNIPAGMQNLQSYTVTSPTRPLPQFAGQYPQGYPFAPPSVAYNPSVISPRVSNDNVVSGIPSSSMITTILSNPAIPPSGSIIPTFNSGMLPPAIPSPPFVQNPSVSSGLPIYTPNPQPVKATQKPLPSSPSVPTLTQDNSNLDSSILNNLAIALQLLIVNNILSKPVPEFNPGKISLPFDAIPPISSFLPKIIEVPSPSYYSTHDSVSKTSFMPNANFVGSSSVADPIMRGLTDFKPPTRSSFSLMSPYDAIGPSSPFSDSILSSLYSPTQFEFQSPYAAIMTDDKDLFSMTDLF